MGINLYENKDRDRQEKLLIVLIFSIIMIFFSFTLYENRRTSYVTNTNNALSHVFIRTYKQ